MHHDHAHAHGPVDRADAIKTAHAVAAAAGETLTPLRQRVLELLLDRGAPAKAYDLLADLGDGSGPAKPPTVYRALEFLVRLGLAHRLETINAFIACDLGSCTRDKVFLICERCGAASEADAGHARVDLSEAAERLGFTIARSVIEAQGVCAACKAAA